MSYLWRQGKSSHETRATTTKKKWAGGKQSSPVGFKGISISFFSMQTAWSISTERRKDNCGESSLSQAQHCASQTPNIQLVHSSPDSCNAFFTAIVSISCLWPWWEKEGVLWKIDYQRHWAHLLSFPSASWNVFVCRLGIYKKHPQSRF